MKFRKFGQCVLASATALAMAIGLTACTTSGSIDFLYVTASKNNPGQVAVYRVDTQSGTLRALQSPVYPAGRNPVALVISANEKNLYVVNHDENTIIDFAIGTDGKLYPQHTYNTPGTCPSAAATDAAGAYLYVLDSFQPNVSAPNCVQTANSGPGAGGVVVYPIASDGSLGTAVVNTSVSPNVSYFPTGTGPVAVAVTTLSTGTYVYVVNKTDATVSEFSSSSGTLTALTTLPVGSAPDALAVATVGTGTYVYITDSALNKLFNYSINTSGTLTANSSVPSTATGNAPSGLTFDSNGNYLYVTNYSDNTLTGYSIATPSGLATDGVPVSIGTSFGTGTGPTCVIVEPSLQKYVYTSNFLDSTVSGFQKDVATGKLTTIQNSPYTVPGAAGQPTCVAAIKHGKHTASTE